MECVGIHVQLDRDTGQSECLRVRGVLIHEEIDRSDKDVRGGKTAEVVSTRRRSVRRHVVLIGCPAEVGVPAAGAQLTVSSLHRLSSRSS